MSSTRINISTNGPLSIDSHGNDISVAFHCQVGDPTFALNHYGASEGGITEFKTLEITSKNRDGNRESICLYLGAEHLAELRRVLVVESGGDRDAEPDYVKEHRLEKLMTGNWEHS